MKSVLALPEFRGRGRLIRFVRDSSYRPYERKLDKTIRMELDTYEWTQLTLAAGTFTEPRTIDLIKQLLAPGDVFVDVGAHVGTMGLVARSVIGPTGKVIAIEPQPYNCQRLMRNWELNGFENLLLIVGAAGSECSTVSLPQQSVADKARLSLALPMPDAIALHFVVPVVTLDSVIEKNDISNVKLLKIDVEGYEFEVLQGLSRHISRVNHIILEVLDPAKHADQTPHNGTALIDWLKTRGFKLLTVDGALWNGDFPILESNLWATREFPN